MSKDALERGVWSAGLWLCGWATHEQFTAGKAIGLSLACAALVWMKANFTATRAETNQREDARG